MVKTVSSLETARPCHGSRRPVERPGAPGDAARVPRRGAAHGAECARRRMPPLKAKAVSKTTLSGQMCPEKVSNPTTLWVARDRTRSVPTKCAGRGLGRRHVEQQALGVGGRGRRGGLLARRPRDRGNRGQEQCCGRVLLDHRRPRFRGGPVAAGAPPVPVGQVDLLLFLRRSDPPCISRCGYRPTWASFAAAARRRLPSTTRGDGVAGGDDQLPCGRHCHRLRPARGERRRGQHRRAGPGRPGLRHREQP